MPQNIASRTSSAATSGRRGLEIRTGAVGKDEEVVAERMDMSLVAAVGRRDGNRKRGGARAVVSITWMLTLNSGRHCPPAGPAVGTRT